MIYCGTANAAAKTKKKKPIIIAGVGIAVVAVIVIIISSIGEKTVDFKKMFSRNVENAYWVRNHTTK